IVLGVLGAATVAALILTRRRGVRLGRVRFDSIDALIRDIASRTGLVAFPGHAGDDLSGLLFVGGHGALGRFASIRFERDGGRIVAARIRVGLNAPRAARGLRIVRGLWGLEVQNRSGHAT